MPRVSILTPAAPSVEPYIRGTADSVLGLQPVPGWDVEWLVTVDGDPSDQKVRLVDTLHTIQQESGDLDWLSIRVAENPHRMWSGFSRNRGLIRSTGDYVAMLDGDDLLTVDAVAHWVAAIEESGDAQWWAFDTQDFYPDGSIVDFPSPWGRGPVAAGVWLDHYTETGKHPHTPIGVVYVKDLLVAVGGWAAGGAAQDAHPTLSATTRADGWCSPAVTYLYRKHDRQITHGVTDGPLSDMRLDAIDLAVASARLQRRDFPVK